MLRLCHTIFSRKQISTLYRTTAGIWGIKSTKLKKKPKDIHIEQPQVTDQHTSFQDMQDTQIVELKLTVQTLSSSQSTFTPFFLKSKTE